MASERAANVSVLPDGRHALMEVGWEDINEPGAYVEKDSGDLYRIPQEALIRGGSPLIMKESRGASRLLQVSKNPFVTDFEARHRCAQYNIEPNF
jgi:hypothetical protein